MNSRAEHLRALGALIFGACVLGLASTLVRLSEAGPAATGFWRVTLALPWLLLWAHRSAGSDIARPSRLALFAGVMFGVDIAFWHYGVMNTSLANSNVLANLTPVVVTVIAWLFLNQKPRRLFLAALALAVAGAWILAQPADTPSSNAATGNRALGDLLSAASCLWYAMYLLATGAARRSETTLKVMLWSTLAAAPTMLIIALLLGERVFPSGVQGWIACVALGIVHVAGQGSIAWALGRLQAATASIVVLVQPVVAEIGRAHV